MTLNASKVSSMLEALRFPITADNRSRPALRAVLGDLRDVRGALAGVGDYAARAGRRMRNVGAGMTAAITAPIAGMGALILRTGGQFEASMNRVAALSGASGDQLEALRDTAREMGATTQYSASQAADAMGFLAMAGFSATQTMEALPATLQLASAAGVELAMAADIVSNVMSGYGMQVDELGRANDVLVATFTSTNTNLEQLGVAMAYVGPVASSAGISFEETAAAIGLMGNAGIQGSMAGTSLRGAISRLLSPSSAAAETMQRLGLQATDAEGRLLPLDNIITQLAPHAEDTAAFMEIFGQRAGPAMAALVSQGADALTELTAELQESGGTAARIGAVQMQGFNGAILGMRSAFENLQLAIADSGLLDFATDLVDRTTGFLRNLAELDPSILRVVTAVAGFVAIAGPAVMALGLLTMGAGMVMTGFAAMGAVMMASPIIAFIAALAYGAYQIYENWGDVGTWFEGVMATVSGAFDAAWEAIGQAIGINNPETLLGQTWGAVGDHFRLWLVEIPTIFGSVFSDVLDLIAGRYTVLDVLGIWWSSVAGWFRGWLAPIVDHYRDMWNNVMELVQTWRPQMEAVGRDIVQGLINGVTWGAAGLYSTIRGLISGITEESQDVLEIQSPSRVFQRIGNFVMEGLAIGLQDGRKGTMAAMSESVEGLTDAASELPGAFGGLGGSIGSTFSAIIRGAESAQDAINRLLDQMADRLLTSSFDMLFDSLFSGGGKRSGGGGFLSGLFGGLFAQGAAFSHGRVTAFASGGVVSGTTAFPMSGGTGLMGEAGPEAIMPLTRTASGDLGVRAVGGGGGVQVVIENNAPGVEVAHTGSETAPDGRRMERFVIATVQKGQREGMFDGSNGARFGVRPQAVRR